MVPFLIFMFLSTNNPFFEVGLYQNTQNILSNRGKGNEYYAGNDCKALLLAVKERDSTKVAELLKTVDPDCTYRGGGEPRSPLVTAARNGDPAIGKLLMDAGAEAGFHVRGDETPLMAAAGNGNLKFVKLLVANGAVVNKSLKGEGTALLVASGEGHLETVKYLISLGAEINDVVTGDGSPLINAVRNGHYEVAKLLLENGADPYLASPGDEYPMYHAREAKDKAMISLLKNYEK